MRAFGAGSESGVGELMGTRIKGIVFVVSDALGIGALITKRGGLARILRRGSEGVRDVDQIVGTRRILTDENGGRGVGGGAGRFDVVDNCDYSC